MENKIDTLKSLEAKAKEVLDLCAKVNELILKNEGKK